MIDPSNQETKKSGLIIQTVAAVIVAMVVIFVVKKFVWDKDTTRSVQPSQPSSFTQPVSNNSLSKKYVRQDPVVDAGGIRLMDKQHILTRTGKVVFPIYNQALSIAWQELVDRGFATRDPNDPKLITVQYPVEPGSTQMQTKVVDISQQLLITSTTQKKGFNYNNDTVWVQIKVDPNSHQLQLEAYQNPQYIDSELVPALGLAFNTFAQGSGYEGPLPAITAFNDIDLDK